MRDDRDLAAVRRIAAAHRVDTTKYKPLVAVESPLRGRVPRWVPTALAPTVEYLGRLRNKRYAVLCMRDSLARGEAPYASHLLLDQHGLLDDAQPDERVLGMSVGQAWTSQASVLALYCDYGISDGMLASALGARADQRLDFRMLYPFNDPRVVKQVKQLQERIHQARGTQQAKA